MAADHELVVRTAPLRTEDVTLDVDALEELIGERTRVVAFTLASNAVGSIPDAGRIAAAAHSAGALAWADGVHLAPHRRLRARELGLDVVLCSPYKFFGPHLGIAAIRPDLAESLPADRVRPAAEDPPGAPLRDRHAVARGDRRRHGGDRLPARARRRRSRRRLRADRGARDAARGALPERAAPRGRLYGIRTPEGRTPTFCFNVDGRAPREVAELLAEQDLYVWDGDYYALEPMRALGIADSGGAVRAGFLHYTTEDEVDRLLEALASSWRSRARLGPLRIARSQARRISALPGITTRQ